MTKEEYLALLNSKPEQFADGGELLKPSNEPTYADSLMLMNNSKALTRFYGRPEYKVTSKTPGANFNQLAEARNRTRENIKNGQVAYTGNKDITYSDYYKKLNDNQFNQRESSSGTLNMKAPIATYDKRIKPDYTLRGETDSIQTNVGNVGDIYEIPMYDALKVTPYSELQKNPAMLARRIQKYGYNGLPESLKTNNEIATAEQKATAMARATGAERTVSNFENPDGSLKKVPEDNRITKIAPLGFSTINTTPSYGAPIEAKEPSKLTATNTLFNTYGNPNAPMGEITVQGGERLQYENQNQLNNLKDFYSIPTYGWGGAVGGTLGAAAGITAAVLTGGAATPLIPVLTTLGSKGGNMVENRVNENQMIDGGRELPLNNPNAQIAESMIGDVAEGAGKLAGMSMPSTQGAGSPQGEVAQPEAPGLQKYGGMVKYAMGGTVFNPNAEVEHGEMGLMPNGSTKMFNGDEHGEDTDGDGREGIQRELEPGTKILSNKLKMNGKTFADMGKKYNNDKYQKILDNPQSSKMDKDTANMMMKQNHERLESIYALQDKMKIKKGLPSDIDTFDIGGTVNGSYPRVVYDENGNIVNYPETNVAKRNYYPALNTSLNTDLNYKPKTGLDPLNQNINNNYMDTTPFSPNLTEQDFQPTEIVPNTSTQNYTPENIIPNPNKDYNINFNEPDKPVDWKKYGEMAAMYGPTASNLARGIFGRPDKLDRRAYTVDDRLKYRDINIDPALRAIDEQSQVANTAIGGADSSTGAMLSRKADLSTNAGAQKAKLMVDAQNTNNQGRQGVDQFNIGMEEKTQRQIAANEAYNKAAKDQKTKTRLAGYTGASDIAQVREQMKNQKGADDIRLSTLNSILSNYDISPELIEKIRNGTASKEEINSIFTLRKPKV